MTKDERYARAVERNLNGARTYKASKYRGMPPQMIKRMVGIRADDESYDEQVAKIARGEQ